MSSYNDLVEAGNNFRPVPWQVAKTIYYWTDSDKSPDIPIPKEWTLLHKSTKAVCSPPPRTLL